MKPEVYFLRYAFPCSHILWKLLKEIPEEDYRRMENAAASGEVLPREFLEKIFFRAFGRIEKVASKLGKDKWDIDVIKEYFRVKHNEALEVSDHPDSFKDMCRIYAAEVLEINGNELIVKFDGEKKRKVKSYVKDIKIGDKVRIHYGFGVEKV